MSGSLVPKRNALGLSKEELFLVAITAFWGGTFIIVQYGLKFAEPFFFVGTRFAVAAVLAIIISHDVIRHLTRREVFAGTLIGVCIFWGYSLQTIGLLYIPSSKSAFILALYVPFVPVLQWVVLRKRPPLMRWVGIAFAFSGLVLLSSPEGSYFAVGKGEMLTIASAVVIAGEIIFISFFAGTVDIRRVTVVQVSVAAILSFVAVPISGESIPSFSWIFIICAGGLGLASTLIQLVMNWAQKSVSPTRATLIYAGEPVWAGLIGRIAGERLPASALLGALLVILGVIISELKATLKKEKNKS